MILHFYKRTVQPDEYTYYNHSLGIAGFETAQKGVCLFTGTIEEFESLEHTSSKITHLRRLRT